MHDAIIIGGGPGGSTTAALLAVRGWRVLLLERERFPRFHIGESLLPYNWPIFEELGVLPELQAAGFPIKTGAQFHLGNGSKSLKLVFREGRFTEQPKTFQVERSTFDHILLKNAAAKGAEVREAWQVRRFEQLADRVRVEATAPDGAPHMLEARFLVDASGRANVTGNQEGLRVIHPALRKIALFGHYTGVALDAGEKAGDTVIVRLANKWFWLIPISATKVSVGCVLDGAELATAKIPAQELFNQIAATSPVVRERMNSAQLVGDFHTTSDFSYYNRRLTGPRLLRVGDAAGFMDPIFSAGVFLAMFSGQLAADTLDACLRRPFGTGWRFARYERKTFHALHFYWEMVEQYYTRSFMELFLEPREKWSLPAAVNAALAGELTGRWAIQWRMRLFFWLVKIQAHLPLVPRIRFD
ncbi:MAG: NAD(P)/FAD-dependent oxidoreductase [Acidobacteria bacterium]|nr:NAD(P)/FAD-dependent oxidoreductase [Acidobacteriota bacterium]